MEALEDACSVTKLSVAKLLEKCGAIPSTHDYHLNRFLLEHFPEGPGFGDVSAGELTEPKDLPTADVVAFSIDDATTTEIDDAFSVTPLSLGSFRVGVHIAIPTLGIAPESPLDSVAAHRLSTVYLPGGKITMLPDAVIQHYTLKEGEICPALSMYLDVADDFTVIGTTSRIDRIKVAENSGTTPLKDISTNPLSRLDHWIILSGTSCWRYGNLHASWKQTGVRPMIATTTGWIIALALMMTELPSASGAGDRRLTRLCPN